MARISVSNYEIDRDLLPPVCVRCGAPAADRVVQTLYIIDGWRGVFQLFGLLFGLFFFPPLVMIVTRYVQQASARLPVCPLHRDELAGREVWAKRWLLPVWTTGALVADALVVVDLLTDRPGNLCFAPVVAMLAGIIGAGFAHRGRI